MNLRSKLIILLCLCAFMLQGQSEPWENFRQLPGDTTFLVINQDKLGADSIITKDQAYLYVLVPPYDSFERRQVTHAAFPSVVVG